MLDTDSYGLLNSANGGRWVSCEYTYHVFDIYVVVHLFQFNYKYVEKIIYACHLAHD